MKSKASLYGACSNRRKKELINVLLVLVAVSIGFLLIPAGHRNGTAAAATIAMGPFTVDLNSLPLYWTLFATLFLLVHLYVRVKLPHADPLIIPVLAFLSGIGLLIMLRLAPDLAYSRSTIIASVLARDPGASITNNADLLAQLGTRHLAHIVLGALALILPVNLFNERVIRWIASKKYIWVLASISMVTVTLIFGTKINGRRLWLFGFQTVELVKIFMLFFAAAYVSEKGKALEAYQRNGFSHWLGYAAPFVVAWCFALIPLFIQRDLGPTASVFGFMLLLFWGAGGRFAVAGLFILLLVGAGYLSYVAGYPPVVRERFDILFDPFGRSEAMTRALWSLAGGGLWGTGLGLGQSYKIPEVQSDFSFVAICEETGVIGAFAVLAAYGVLLHRTFRTAARSASTYKKTLITGVGILFGLQILLIVFGNLAVIPLSGITLPFVSHGGSSLIVSFAMAGIVLRISEEAQ